MARQHTQDLFNVSKDDQLRLDVTGKEDPLHVVCTDRMSEHSQRPGTVRETTTWEFECSDGEKYYAQVVDGLPDSPDEGPFPKHNPLFDSEAGEQLGMIQKLKLYGAMA